MTKIMITAIASLWAATGIAANSATEDCRAIESDTERLACYDGRTETIERESVATTEPVAASTSAVLAGQTASDTTRNAGTVSPIAASTTTALAAQTTPTETERAVADVSPEDMFGRSADETTRILEQSINIENLEFLDATVEQIDRNRFGKLSIVLSNRQTWKQSDSSRMNLRVGDEIRIERAALGSYLLEKKSGSTSIRVKRVE